VYKRLTIAATAVIFFLCGCGRAQSAEPERYEQTFFDVFDTVTTIVLYDEDADRAAKRLQAVHDELLTYHELYDAYETYEGVNNIRTINENAGIAPVRTDERLTGLLLFAKDMDTLTDGRMNVAMGSVLSIWHDYREAGLDDPENAELPPMEALREAAKHTDISGVIVDETAGTVYLSDAEEQLDIGAVAKGYAAQRVADDMRAQGVTSMLLSVGGNVCAIGGRPDGSAWRVAVQDPASGGTLCTLEVRDESLVTSGTYQRYYTVDGKRYHHIIDPDTLMPETYFDSVSVLCADSGLADALSTGLANMPLGEGLALVESLDGVEALWVQPDGTQTQSDGFSAYVLQD